MEHLCRILPHWCFLWRALCFAADDGLVISPLNHDFGSAFVNQSTSQTFTLKNISDRKNVTQINPGSPPLAEPFNYVGGVFPGTGGSCSSSLTLTPGQSCTVVVRFQPTSVGGFSGTLAFAYRLQNAPKIVSTGLKGTGTAAPLPLVILEGGAYDFLQRPIGYSARKTLTLKNPGLGTATGLGVSTAPALPFSFEGGSFPGNDGTCQNGGSIGPGSSCTVVMSFTAGTTGTFMGTVAFSILGVAPTSIDLSGEGQSVQVAGTSDVSYGANSNGISSSDLGGSSEVISSLIRLEDDGIVAAGSAYVGQSNDFAISRYRVNGQLDTQFNTTGYKTMDFGGNQDILTAVIEDSNHRYTLAGHSAKDCAFVRLNSNGALDTSFNSTGSLILDLSPGSEDYCHDVRADLSGRTVAVGYSRSQGAFQGAIVRMNPDGALDTNFNGSGKVLSVFGTGNTFFYSLGLQSDGKWVVAGTSLGTRDYDYFVARYNDNGTLDTSFNGTGFRWLDFGASHDKVTDLMIDRNGRIFLAGRFSASSDDETVGMAVVKLLPDGSYDTSFGNNGKYRPPAISGQDVSATIRETPSGDIVIAWSVAVNGSPFTIRVTKLQPNGHQVLSFGTGGTLTTSIRATRGQRSGFAVQGDGKGLVGGTLLGDFALARFW